MGRSTSCFKIITCGGGSADEDDLQAPENKNSTEGCGWSFRKRSVRHRVLSNTIITEASYSANKESTESASLNFQSPDTSTVPDKISVIQCTDEKPHLSTLQTQKYLRLLLLPWMKVKLMPNLKSLLLLSYRLLSEAVCRHAVGTLRCIQAIVKMQALVRARCARLMQEGSYTEEKIDGKHEKAILKTSLMESTPKTRPIHIKCDSSKPNSAWNWLERWMSVSSTEPTPKPELTTEQQLEIEKSGDVVTEVEAAVPSEGFYDFKFQEHHLTSSLVGDNSEQPQPKNISASDAKEPSIDTNSLPNQTMESDVNCQMEISCKAEIEGEQTDQPKRSMKRYASEQPETEGKKFVFGSRKVSKPAFIAAQSKFEEPSSTANSNRSLSSSYQDGGVESNMDTISCGTDTVMRTKALNMVENSVPNNSRAQYGGSECGTELSVTSTLDSPDVNPEASPRSHIAVPESQGTPSSQVSSKAKRNKADKSASNQKRKSISESKQSPTNPNHDSGARSSVEQMPKDQRNGKRRNSFGSARPDPTDQEPRDDGSSSSSSLPHFMQVTESARAKIQANNSPRSSPDVQDRDYIKKRHSLPGANGRQGSPRIQRSMSQAQPGAKGNGSHVIHGIL
ncbi:hypothetical protein GH714_006480 [Hevea brasiliensis]|uniref:DUF4005 domain-containing protein n=1 Tax=Hevea brasiliensis TaxID=3981 RepID=A0A6A6M8S8_HEVBR|nr:hypothetical protein GH714_006480 [Hevea brasiliensis]